MDRYMDHMEKLDRMTGRSAVILQNIHQKVEDGAKPKHFTAEDIAIVRFHKKRSSQAVSGVTDPAMIAQVWESSRIKTGHLKLRR